MASKPVPSLRDMMAAELSKEGKVVATPPVTKAVKSPSKPARHKRTADVVALSVPQPEAAPATTAHEIEKVTLYLPRPVYRFIKQTALELDRRPHDLLMQGIDLLLAQHGKSLKDFSGK